MSMKNLQHFISSAPSILHLGYHSKNLSNIQTFHKSLKPHMGRDQMDSFLQISSLHFVASKTCSFPCGQGCPLHPAACNKSFTRAGCFGKHSAEVLWSPQPVSPEHLTWPKLRAPSWCVILSHIPCTYITEKWVTQGSSCTSNKNSEGNWESLSP